MSRIQVLTNRGVSVVRAAQSKFKKVTVLDAVTSSHFENQANELATKPFSWYNGAVGQVKSVKSGGNHLKVQVTFPATPYAQPLKSVGIRILAEGEALAEKLLDDVFTVRTEDIQAQIFFANRKMKD